jgi:hypothetical protein
MAIINPTTAPRRHFIRNGLFLPTCGTPPVYKFTHTEYYILYNNNNNYNMNNTSTKTIGTKVNFQR